MTDLTLGSTELIIDACKAERASVEQAAYILATAYWETARTMEPVQEAFWLSDQWRKQNLRYYPWHGRGFVQLTWRDNYVRAGEKLGEDFITDPTRVMEPPIAARILVRGMLEGWFTGKALPVYVDVDKRDYRNARRVVNGMDKATTIADLARQYEAALISAGYTVGGPVQAPMLGRTSKMESTTLQATAAAVASGGAGVATAVSQLDGTVQIIVIGTACVAFLALLWIARERIRRWTEGDR